ncbi:DUF6179 domain-containing protein [Anaerosacchariphilus polymeriproducens]|uniref:Uncharacterized protein n=1 Tax=Anaerosacchariphilus polymeriproducens TaxID=1812858 RepID=A0A371AYP8_9FIRM|nr:DUF6179 domain-containing protein [Anaerosacchariphilus polymeriproducens]RDU24724.1 hypothetical protein DWV06_04450 [Anaerosacchariphilus polymeriproducens]
MNFSEEEILQLLSDRVRKYTSNESSSVSYEKARQLMGSILFCMEDAQSCSQNNEKKLTLFHKKMNAKEAFEVGLNKKKVKIKETQKLFETIMKTFCTYQNQCYYDTIIKGMPGFFKTYDVEYNAQNHILTLDYPLITAPSLNLKGIDLIYEYLKRTWIEQCFLSSFSYDNILDILKNYHKKHEELIFNICRVVFRNAIGCVLLDKSIYELMIQCDERELLKRLGDSKNVAELEAILIEAFERMLNLHFNNNQEYFVYFLNEIKDFAFEIKSNAENNHLDKIFLGSTTVEPQNQVIYKDGSPMEDEKLRELIDGLSQIRFLTEKLDMIKTQVKSLEDLKEVLKECFFDEEFLNVFALLSTNEIEVLKEEIIQKIEYNEELEEWEIAFKKEMITRESKNKEEKRSIT